MDQQKQRKNQLKVKNKEMKVNKRKSQIRWINEHTTGHCRVHEHLHKTGKAVDLLILHAGGAKKKNRRNSKMS